MAKNVRSREYGGPPTARLTMRGSAAAHRRQAQQKSRDGFSACCGTIKGRCGGPPKARLDVRGSAAARTCTGSQWMDTTRDNSLRFCCNLHYRRPKVLNLASYHNHLDQSNKKSCILPEDRRKISASDKHPHCTILWNCTMGRHRGASYCNAFVSTKVTPLPKTSL